MPSGTHEVLVALFRDYPALAPAVLAAASHPVLPRHARVLVSSA